MNIVIMILMLLTLLTVLAGLGIMIKGGELNKKYGNRMMMLRVGLQATTIGLIFVIAMLAGK